MSFQLSKDRLRRIAPRLGFHDFTVISKPRATVLPEFFHVCLVNNGEERSAIDAHFYQRAQREINKIDHCVSLSSNVFSCLKLINFFF